MNQNWITYLQLLNLQKQQRKRIGAVIAALSVAVTGSVSWKLHGIGTAMVDEALTDSGERYAETLSADGSIYENPSVWEATLPDVSGFPLSERIAAVAESQLGYHDSRWSFTNELGEELQKRYSRYGDWYGNPSGDWNTMFTYFCLHYGGADENTVSYGSGCWAWSVELEKNGLIIPVSRGSPQRGDVIFLDTDLDGKADRSGVITCISGEEEQQLLKAAEGDVEGAVAEQEYAFSDEYLIGYLHIEAVEDDAPPDETESPEDAQTQSATEFSGVTDSGITVRAVADENAFPADTVMTVSDIAREEAVKAAADSLGKEEDALDAVAVDISFRDADGTEIEPAPESSVQVQITLPEELRLGSGAYSLLHVSDEGDVQTVENASVSADGAEFVTGSFSVFVFVSGNPQPLGDITMINGQKADNNSASNPYLVYVGDTLEVFMDGTFWTNDNQVSGNANGYTDKLGLKSKNNATVTVGGVEYSGVRGSYVALAPGDCNQTDGTNRLYIRVIEPPCVKVKETSGGTTQEVYKKLSDFTMLNANTGGNSDRNPYVIHVGETFEFFMNGDFSTSIAHVTNVQKQPGSITVEETIDGETRQMIHTGYIGSCVADSVGDFAIDDGSNKIYVRVAEAFFVQEKVDGKEAYKDLTQLIYEKNQSPGYWRDDNSETNRYVLYVGDKLNLLYSGPYNNNAQMTVLPWEQNVLGRQPTGYDTVSEAGLTAGFVANNPGECRVILKKDKNNGSVDGDNLLADLYVKVISPIYVKCENGERAKDKIKEYLPGPYGLPDKNGYIQNTASRPYTLRVGDKLKVRSDLAGTFELGDHSEFLRKEDYTEKGFTEDGREVTYVVYTAIDPSNTADNQADMGSAGNKLTTITHKTDSTVNDVMYVHVINPNSNSHFHSDIEIADGGKYIFTSVKFDEHNNKYTVVKEYAAYIEDVNGSRLYSANDTLIKEFLHTDYEKRGEPGGTQYEVTSAFLCLGNNSKYYNPKDIRRAVFDVQVRLTPTITYTIDNEGHKSEPEPLVESGRLLKNVIYDMSEQAVIDAMNKCPMVNGLDFVARANAAMIEFESSKKVLDENGNEMSIPPQAGQFEFELYKVDLKTVKIATDAQTPRQLPAGNVQVTDVFKDYTEGDTVEAYRFFIHDPLQYDTDSFDMDALQARFPQYTGFDLASLMDRLNYVGDNSPQPTDISQYEFHDALYNHTKPDGKIVPTGGTFANLRGHYLFEKDSLVTTVSNDANGNIVFPYETFTKPGIYHYYIREKNTPHDPNVTNDGYDNNVHAVTVTVASDMSVTITYDGGTTPPVFRNKLNTYTLPATGGTGTVPYAVTGMTMIAGATWLLLRTRRKEDT